MGQLVRHSRLGCAVWVGARAFTPVNIQEEKKRIPGS
jgi:hypothetical protein